MLSPKKSKKKKKHKEHQTPVKQQQQQHGDNLQILNTGQTHSSHKKHKRKRRRDDDPETSLLVFKHQKLGASIGDSSGDMTKGTNAPVTPSTPQTVSDIIGSPFKTKHKKHKSKT